MKAPSGLISRAASAAFQRCLRSTAPRDETHRDQLVDEVGAACFDRPVASAMPDRGYRSLDPDCLEHDPQVDELRFDDVRRAEKHGRLRIAI